MPELHSRVFRAVVQVEVLVTVAPDVELTSAKNGLVQIKRERRTSRVDIESIAREAFIDHDDGPGISAAAGESKVSPIEELTS